MSPKSKTVRTKRYIPPTEAEIAAFDALNSNVKNIAVLEHRARITPSGKYQLIGHSEETVVEVTE